MTSATGAGCTALGRMVLGACLGGWAVLGMVGSAAAHAPAVHGFRLVEFNPAPPAPAFSLADATGGRVALADFRGRFVLLNFWATWCPPCVREMPSMERLYQAFRDRGLVVLAVSLDEGGAARVTPFLNRLGITFPVALDPDSRVARTWGAGDLPSSFLIDPTGRVFAAAKGERDWFSPAAQEVFAEILAAR